MAIYLLGLGCEAQSKQLINKWVYLQNFSDVSADTKQQQADAPSQYPNGDQESDMPTEISFEEEFENLPDVHGLVALKLNVLHQSIQLCFNQIQKQHLPFHPELLCPPPRA